MPYPRKLGARREAHGKATARMLTAAELAERDLMAVERRDKKQRQRTSEAKEEGVIVLATPETSQQRLRHHRD